MWIAHTRFTQAFFLQKNHIFMLLSVPDREARQLMVSTLEERQYFVFQSLRQPLTFGNQDEI